MIIASLSLIPKFKKKNMAIYKSKFTGAQVDSMLESISSKQDALIAGNGIDISGNVISVSLNFQLYEIVTTLPVSGQSSNKIYLKLSQKSSNQNKYTEYLWTEGGWEILGEFTTSIDLSTYATKEELSTLNSTVNTNSANITQAKKDIAQLQNKISPITDDAEYEVILFKKQA